MTNLNNKANPKWILVVVVKYRHRAIVLSTMNKKEIWTTSEIYGWKITGYLISICSFSSCEQNFSKANCFVFTESWSRYHLLQKALCCPLFDFLNGVSMSKLNWIYYFTLKRHLGEECGFIVRLFRILSRIALVRGKTM